jgi:hypothetical protein
MSDREEELKKIMQGKQTPRDYVSIRVSAFHVKKGWLGFFSDNKLGRVVCVPDDRMKAMELFEKIDLLMKEYGVEYKPKEKMAR